MLLRDPTRQRYTLIGTGNGHSILEVTPAKQIAWSLHQNDLPGIQLAWVTSLQVLPGGNILINNCHAGPKNPQLIEVSRDKNVVWKFLDFDRFGGFPHEFADPHGGWEGHPSRRTGNAALGSGKQPLNAPLLSNFRNLNPASANFAAVGRESS